MLCSNSAPTLLRRVTERDVRDITELTSPLNLTLIPQKKSEVVEPSSFPEKERLPKMYLNAASQDEMANITLSFEEIRLRRLPLIVRSPLSDGNSGRRDDVQANEIPRDWKMQMTSATESHVIMAIGTLGCHERRFRLVDDKTLPAACLYERKLDSTFALHFTTLFKVSNSG
ncbi:hypothetical protein G5I_01355 [Acromyrmex echinatior]|uniref:Uncharacterized protein n=1 Tax=Acromyrmex echinatior TaxID=103372 RepID=F4W7D9_ACREC|nr:hypothetical protein G5I_01355 [Acromyrmex echinatior]